MSKAMDTNNIEKLAAYNEMQELRKMTAAYGLIDFDAERDSAVSEKYGEFIHRMTEEEFFRKVDEGLADVEAGEYIVSESVEAEIAAEFGL